MHELQKENRSPMCIVAHQKYLRWAPVTVQSAYTDDCTSTTGIRIGDYIVLTISDTGPARREERMLVTRVARIPYGGTRVLIGIDDSGNPTIMTDINADEIVQCL